MIVVSDTTAITSLLKIQRIDLLAKLFGDVRIPEAVRDEILAYHSELPQLLQVQPIKNGDAVALLQTEIDKGEAEAIVLAQELGAEVLLIDEKRGRAVAEQRGLKCLGLAGAMLLAKQTKVIPSLTVVLNDLEAKANFYLDENLKLSLLRRANEIE